MLRLAYINLKTSVACTTKGTRAVNSDTKKGAGGEPELQGGSLPSSSSRAPCKSCRSYTYLRILRLVGTPSACHGEAGERARPTAHSVVLVGHRRRSESGPCRAIDFPRYVRGSGPATLPLSAAAATNTQHEGGGGVDPAATASRKFILRGRPRGNSSWKCSLLVLVVPLPSHSSTGAYITIPATSQYLL